MPSRNDQGLGILYSGSVSHAGGEISPMPPLGLTDVLLSQLRQEENHYLFAHLRSQKFRSSPQDILGYTQGEHALGYYTDHR